MTVNVKSIRIYATSFIDIHICYVNVVEQWLSGNYPVIVSSTLCHFSLIAKFSCEITELRKRNVAINRCNPYCGVFSCKIVSQTLCTFETDSFLLLCAYEKKTKSSFIRFSSISERKNLVLGSKKFQNRNERIFRLLGEMCKNEKC